jgi:hypothetical protein
MRRKTDGSMQSETFCLKLILVFLALTACGQAAAGSTARRGGDCRGGRHPIVILPGEHGDSMNF